MSTLTVREKEHWKERITRKVEQAVEALLAAENPNYRDRQREKARRLALESLGIARLQDQLDELAEQEKECRTKRAAIYGEMLATACGILNDRPYSGGCSDLPYQVLEAIRRRQSLHERELLANDDLGRKLLALEREKEELLDTVWLATSGKQIKQLWQKVAELLGQESTPFQQQALGIDPVEDE
jgi:hypothetical protein